MHILVLQYGPLCPLFAVSLAAVSSASLCVNAELCLFKPRYTTDLDTYLFRKTQTQLNFDSLVRVCREWEAEEFAEGFPASLSLITMLIKVYWLIVAEIVVSVCYLLH